MERSGEDERSSAKKAKIESATEPEASEQVTVTLDSKLLDCSVCLRTMAPPLFQVQKLQFTDYFPL
jgi:NADPH-dependent 7-cyano-7-deazaguanine reductase QueF